MTELKDMNGDSMKKGLYVDPSDSDRPYRFSVYDNGAVLTTEGRDSDATQDLAGRLRPMTNQEVKAHDDYVQRSRHLHAMMGIEDDD